MDSVRVVVAFLVEVAKRLFSIILKALPTIWKVTKLILTMMYHTALVMWGAVVPEVDNMAEAISYHLIPEIPVPLWEYVKRASRIMAFLIALSSWILLSFTTVWICRLLFQLLWRGVLK